MKRLIIISVMLVCGGVQSKAADQRAHEVIQSSHDTNSKISDEVVSIANIHHIDLDTTEARSQFSLYKKWQSLKSWFRTKDIFFRAVCRVVQRLHAGHCLVDVAQALVCEGLRAGVLRSIHTACNTAPRQA